MTKNKSSGLAATSEEQDYLAPNHFHLCLFTVPETSSFGKLLNEEQRLLCKGANTLKNALKNLKNNDDDIAFAKKAGILLPNGFQPMPPFTFPGMEMFMDSDSEWKVHT